MDILDLKGKLISLSGEYHLALQEMEDKRKTYKEVEASFELLEAKTILEVKAKEPELKQQESKAKVTEIIYPQKMQLIESEAEYRRAETEVSYIEKQIMLICKMSDLVDREISMGLYNQNSDELPKTKTQKEKENLF